MKELIRKGIRFLEFLFTRPTYWLVTAPLYKVILTWLIGYMFLGLLMTAGGIVAFWNLEVFFAEHFSCYSPIFCVEMS